MSTTTQPTPSGATTRSTGTGAPVRAAKTPTSSPSDRRFSPRRTWALASAEIRLLVRNKALLFYSMGLPVLGGLFMLRVLPDTGEGADQQVTRLIVTITGFALLFGVYYSLVSTFVARRQDLVLKRLRSGESSVLDVLAAISLPSLLTMVVQTVVGSATMLRETGTHPTVLRERVWSSPDKAPAKIGAPSARIMELVEAEDYR